MFYSDILDRKFAHIKAKKYHKYLIDYNYHRKRKYPSGRLKDVYKTLITILT